MPTVSVSCSTLTPKPATSLVHDHTKLIPSPPRSVAEQPRRRRTPTVFAAKSGVSLNSVLKRCQKCGGKGAIECPGCKGTGKNKKNGNIFERWKCFDCQGFGLKSCPNCGKGGLTPEQRGER